jgi:peptide/nickel transport system substrate-binding protein
MQLAVRIKTCLMGLATILTLLAVACGASATPAPSAGSTPAAGSTTAAPAAPTQAPKPAAITPARSDVNIVVGAEPPTLDAFLETTTTFSWFTGNFVETLTMQDTQTVKPVAGSGFSKWEQKDPKRWRFFLRPGIKFSNGELWNAQAAKYNIDYSGDKTNNSSSYAQTSDLVGEVVDDLTVDVVCANACPILDTAAMWLAFQAPAWHKAAPKEERVRNAIGYGPYKLVKWEPGQTIKATKYDAYVAAPDRYDYRAPTIKDITWHWRSEESVRSAMMIAGEADVGHAMPLDDVARLPKHFIGTEGATYGFRLDTIWEPVLRDVKLRRALVHALDCPAMAQSFFNGQTKCRGSVVHPNTFGVDEAKIPPYKFDPALAKQLLKESGYAGQELKVYAREERRPKGIEVAEAAVNSWREVGINAKLVILESAKWNDFHRTGPGKYGKDALDAANRPPPAPANSSPQILSGSTMGSPDTRELGRNFNFYLSCYTDRAKVCEPNRLQPMIEAALAASGEDRRQKLEAIAQIVHDEVLVIPLFDTITVWGMAKNLEWQPRLVDESIRVNTMKWTK